MLVERRTASGSWACATASARSEGNSKSSRPSDSGRGFARLSGVEVGDETNVGPVGVRATYAEHDGRRPPLGGTASAVGYVITGSACVYFAGDTDLFSGMSNLAQELDVALLPVAGWGAH